MTRVKRFSFLIVSLIAASALKAQSSYRFDFGEGAAPKGYTKITPATRYTAAQGYGLEFDSVVTANTTDKKGVVQDDYLTSSRPFSFSVKLPEGAYNVKVT